MLKELFQGTSDLADTDWRQDPQYREAKATEDTAKVRAATLDSEYRRLSIEANQGSEIIRTAPPGHPVHAKQYESTLADAQATQATRAREQAERAAKLALQATGDKARRAGWLPVEQAIEQLSVRLTAFNNLQMQILDRTDVRPVEISSAVGLNEGDLRTFIENVRGALGFDRT